MLKIISGNKAKTQIYCDITKLVEQITEGDENETDGLYQKIDELAKKLGPNMPRWWMGFRTSIRNLKLVRKSSRY